MRLSAGLFYLLAAGAAVVQRAKAVPFLHTPNSVSDLGDSCPSLDFTSQACPRLCARSPGECPAVLSRPCDTASDKSSLCAIPCAVPVGWVACVPLASSTVDVFRVDRKSRAKSVLAGCAAAYSLNHVANQSLIISKDGSYALEACNSEAVGDDCPLNVISPVFPALANEPFAISLISATLSCLALATLFGFMHSSFPDRLAQFLRPLSVLYTPGPGLLARRWSRHRNFLAGEAALTTLFSSCTISCKPVVSSNSKEKSKLRYYTDSSLGSITFMAIVTLTIVVQICLALIVMEHYAFSALLQTFVITNASLLAHYFIIVWHIMCATILSWKICGHVRVRCAFRCPQFSAARANFVCISTVTLPPPLPWAVRDKTPRFLIQLIDFVCHAELWAAKLYLGTTTQRTVHKILLTRVHGLRYFVDACTRHVYNPTLRSFESHSITLATNFSEYSTLATTTIVAGGLDVATRIFRLELLGPNTVHVKSRSFLYLWRGEVSGWFYIYQYSMLWVWYYFEYWKMGLLLSIVILMASVAKTMVRLRAHTRICRLASASSPCVLLRNFEFVRACSAELVPGDIVALSVGSISYDFLLCSGEAVLDESSLTGEPRPVRKFPIPSSDESPLDFETHHRHIVRAGTAVLHAEKGAKGIVLATGSATGRGMLVRKMMRPKPFTFVFDEQFKIVLMCLLLWGILCFSIVVYEMWDGTIAWWFYALFIITEILSPLLPAVLVAGQSVACNRLVRNHKIFCTDLTRITMSGKTKMFCFDKTGTLTNAGQEMSGFLHAEHVASNSLDAMCTSGTELDSLCSLALATCHSLSNFNHSPSGNPVDLAMFAFTNYKLSESAEIVTSGGSPDQSCLMDSAEATQMIYSGQILRRFEFIHAKQTMAAIVRVQIVTTDASESSGMITTDDEKSIEQYYAQIFVKGSPERIAPLCLRESIPSCYRQTCRTLAKSGAYVLALAHKKVLLDENLCRNLSREAAECDLKFLGLLVFRNSLKHDTTDALAELHRGNVRTVMITGDNLHTGIYIARKCGLSPGFTDVAPGPRLLYGDAIEINAGVGVEWCDADTDEKVDIQALWKERHRVPLELAVTGSAWSVLCAIGQADEILLGIRIWARMTPSQKTDVVQRLMEHGITAMCGDGGNDCGAVSAAHVGIALSESEASIVAPFSTASNSVWACVSLLREGRCALASSFAGYKFLIMYGMTMSSMCVAMYYFSVVLPEYTWIMIDGVIVVGSCALLVRAQAQPRLGPQRPTVQLLGMQTVLSIAAQTVTHWIFMASAIFYLYSQSFLRCHEFDVIGIDASHWWLLGNNYEAAVIAAIALPQFINNGAVFNFGHSFRRAWYRNVAYAAFYIVLQIFASVLILTGPNRVTCFFSINCVFAEGSGSGGNKSNVFPEKFRFGIWLMAVSNVLIGLCLERLVILGPIHNWLVQRLGQRGRKINTMRI